MFSIQNSVQYTERTRDSNSVPIRDGKPPMAATIAPIACRDADHDVVVGGDYQLLDQAIDNAAITETVTRTTFPGMRLTTLELGRSLLEEGCEALAKIVALEALFLRLGLARQRCLERILGAKADEALGVGDGVAGGADAADLILDRGLEIVVLDDAGDQTDA